jgi:hypothetical protein
MQGVYILETFPSLSSLYVGKAKSLTVVDGITPALVFVVDTKEKRKET